MVRLRRDQRDGTQGVELLAARRKYRGRCALAPRLCDVRRAVAIRSVPLRSAFHRLRGNAPRLRPSRHHHPGRNRPLRRRTPADVAGDSDATARFRRGATKRYEASTRRLRGVRPIAAGLVAREPAPTERHGAPQFVGRPVCRGDHLNSRITRAGTSPCSKAALMNMERGTRSARTSLASRWV